MSFKRTLECVKFVFHVLFSLGENVVANQPDSLLKVMGRKADGRWT